MISSHVFLFRSNRYRRFARSFEYRWLAGATLEPINNDVAIGTVELPASEPTLAASATSLWILAYEKQRYMTPWFRVPGLSFLDCGRSQIASKLVHN